MILLGTLFIVSCKMPTDDTTSNIDSKNTIETSNEDEEIVNPPKENNDEEIKPIEEEKEDEEINQPQENNGVLYCKLDEDAKVIDLDYVVILNNKLTEVVKRTYDERLNSLNIDCYPKENNDDEKELTGNNYITLYINIEPNEQDNIANSKLTVSRCLASYTNVIVNNVSIKNNIVTIKVTFE